MHIIADLHMHGPYSRGTSKELSFSSIEKYARIKGLGLVGTGDFTHPVWVKEIGKDLRDDGNGIFLNETGFPFLLTSEISLVYTQDGKE